MDILTSIINSIAAQPAIFLGFIAFVGLLLQKKSVESVIEGTVKTIVGTVILFAGIDVFLDSLDPLTSLFRKSLGMTGIMPDVFGPFGIAMKTFATEVALAFVLGFVVHIILVRISPWNSSKNVFLTGHVLMVIPTWFVVILFSVWSLKGVTLTILSGALAGIVFTLFPLCARPFTKVITGDQFTLGHFQTFNVIGGSWIGRLFKSSKKSEEIELPGFLNVFSDYTILLAVLMPIMYLIIAILAGPEASSSLSGNNNWVIWSLMQGMSFAAGVMIILYGVRIFLTSIIPAFEGIAQKVLPGAKPALDSPVFFPFAPVASMIGFVAHGIASILVTLLLVLISSPIVVMPGPIFVFFEGALAGVFGDKFGGWKGATAAGFVIGMITQFGTIPVYHLQGFFHGQGVVFGGTDLVLLSPIIYFVKFIVGLFA